MIDEVRVWEQDSEVPLLREGAVKTIKTIKTMQCSAQETDTGTLGD